MESKFRELQTSQTTFLKWIIQSIRKKSGWQSVSVCTNLDDFNWCWGWVIVTVSVSAWSFNVDNFNNLVFLWLWCWRPTARWMSTIDIDDFHYFRWCRRFRPAWAARATWATEECCWCCAYTKSNYHEHLCSLTEIKQQLVLEYENFSRNPKNEFFPLWSTEHFLKIAHSIWSQNYFSFQIHKYFPVDFYLHFDCFDWV